MKFGYRQFLHFPRENLCTSISCAAGVEVLRTPLFSKAQRGSEARSNCTASDVPANERFSDGEQDSGHNSADHHVAPFEIPVG